MQYEKILENLGLSKRESGVYLATLTLGDAPASAIAKAAGLQRTTVYPILKSLAKQGLVIVSFKKNERFYCAQKPGIVAQRYEKVLNDFTSIIPQLNLLKKNQTPTFGLRFLETPSEIKQFFTDVLITYKNKEYYVISSTQGWMGIDNDFFYRFREERPKANISTKLILTHESKQVDPPNNTLLRYAKYLPPAYRFDSSINIFPDKILILEAGLTSLGVIIEIPAMTDIFKSIFQVLWDILPEES